MGAHFAPPFAMIAMDKIESAALESIRENLHFAPDIYVRYIDDILLGPIDKNRNLPQEIHKTFNNVNDKIKFTLEKPEKSLTFLDMTIEINQNRVDYSWYEKPCHSQNSLKQDSFVPNHVKKNFVTNYMERVRNRCSNPKLENAAVAKLKHKLKKNGH